jgi:endonuclease/exonuclease/phosphatase (EEP) superfamily protein YafD
VNDRRPVTSWDTYSPPRRYQTLWVALGVLAALPGLAATALRITAPTDDIPALFASFIAYGVVAYLLSTALFLIALGRARRRAGLAVVTALSACLLGCHVAWLAPLFVSDHRLPTTSSFTLMSLNTLHGLADPRAIEQEARSADVVVLIEATSGLVQELQPLSWDERFPYSVGVVGGTVGDTVIYSRFPLSNGTRLPTSQFQQWIATAAVPRIGPVRIIAAHPCNPFCGSNQFRSDHQRLQAAVQANLGGPLIVAGDLNAVDDHAPLRALRAVGMESVTDLLGAGWLPTYPANRSIPPLIPIDHILVSPQLTATSVTRFSVPGTDHLGLIAEIARG